MNKIVLSDSDKHELNVAIFFLTVMCLLFALLCSGILIELDLLDLRMESARVFLIIASLTMLIVLAAIGIRYRISGLYLGLAASVGISFSILFAEARLGALLFGVLIFSTFIALISSMLKLNKFFKRKLDLRSRLFSCFSFFHKTLLVSLLALVASWVYSFINSFAPSNGVPYWASNIMLLASFSIFFMLCALNILSCYILKKAIRN